MLDSIHQDFLQRLSARALKTRYDEGLEEIRWYQEETAFIWRLMIERGLTKESEPNGYK